MIGRSVFLFLLAFLSPSVLRATTLDSAALTAIQSFLEATYRLDEPGASVIVVRNGEVAFRQAYGMADLELGVPLRPDMVFRLGSITKQFTAAAIMILEQEGKLSVHDPLSKYLPDYPVQGHKITIEHLLTHTSGIFSYTGIQGYMGNGIRGDLTTDELVNVFKNLPMDFAPGEKFRYNNSGYVLLGAIIEKVSGMSYAEFVTQRIFDPLGMSQSYYGGPQLIPSRVAGYSRNDKGFENAPFLSMTQPHAAGSLLSTVDDLNKWDQSLYTERLLTQESFRKMTTRYRLNDGTETEYGYGFFLGEVRGRKTIEHGGGIFGFATSGIRLPEEGMYVAVLSNDPGRQPSPGYVARKIAGFAVGDPYPEWEPAEVSEDVLQQYVGVYRIDDQTTRTLTLEDGKLYTQVTNGARQQAIPSSESHFFYRNSLSHFEIVRDEQGRIEGMNMYQNGALKPDFAERTDEPASAGRQTVAVDPSILDDYVGTYQLAPGFNLVVTREGDGLFTQATGQSKVQVFPESEVKFFLKVVDAQITFVRGSDGSVNELILHQGGRDTPAKRVP